MTCKDCIHYEVCCDEYELAHAENCNNFKDKSKYIELPCKIGDAVYRIQQPWGLSTLKVAGIHLFWNKAETRVKRHSYIVGLHETLNISCRLPLKDFEQTVFLTKSEAEQKLKELIGDN